MTTPTLEPSPVQRRSGFFPRLAVAAAVLAAVFVVGTIVLSGDGEPDQVAGPALELTAGPHDALASCLAFDVATLATMPVAFEGTVTAAAGEQVTLDVDTWFAGGDSQQVLITAPAGLEALIGGVDFAVGEQYLITATDGTVNYCGYSGPATPDFRAAFQQAFAG